LRFYAKHFINLSPPTAGPIRNIQEPKIVEKLKIAGQKIDAKFAKINAKIQANLELYAISGRVEKSWRNYRGRRIGPYYRVSFYKDGKQHSLHLGRRKTLANRVTYLLADLQARYRNHREYLRLRQQALAALRQDKKILDHLLAPLGFYRKGTEFHRRRS
jgi:hypothetical protein